MKTKLNVLVFFLLVPSGLLLADGTGEECSDTFPAVMRPEGLGCIGGIVIHGAVEGGGNS